MQNITTSWNREIPKVNEIYRHFKGHIYSIIAVGIHTETKEPLVVYRSPDEKYWARPLDMFLSPVDTNKYPSETQKNRFENVTGLNDIIINKERTVNCHEAHIDDIAVKSGRPLPKRGEIYRHFKGGYVVINTIATETETSEALVIYEKNGDTWIRPLEMFLSPVDKEKYPDAKQTYRLEKVE